MDVSAGERLMGRFWKIEREGDRKNIVWVTENNSVILRLGTADYYRSTIAKMVYDGKKFKHLREWFSVNIEREITEFYYRFTYLTSNYLINEVIDELLDWFKQEYDQLSKVHKLVKSLRKGY